MWRFSCSFGSLRSFASVQQVFCENRSTCRCIFDVFVGEGELPVLLPHHLDPILYCKFSDEKFAATLKFIPLYICFFWRVGSCFDDFFLGFLQFDCDVPRCVSLCIDLAGDALSFFNLWCFCLALILEKS